MSNPDEHLGQSHENASPAPAAHESSTSADDDWEPPAEFDFTADSPAGPKEDVIEERPYDPRPHEDGARRIIAYALIGLLSFLVIAMMAALWLGVIAAKDLKEFAVVLGPLVTLVSAATGFYYGTKSNGG